RLHRVVGAERLALVPDAPVVHVPARITVPVVRIVPPPGRGRAGPESPRGIAFVHDAPDDPFVQPIIVHQVAVPVFSRFGEPGEGAHVLVVSAPQGNAGMVPQPLDLVPDLPLDA